MSAEKKKGHIARFEKKSFIRKLGVTDLFAVGYGDLGSSIFYALGITTFFALGAAPISLLLAGIVFICTSLTYAEMTSFPEASAGSASFARLAFNDLISFIAGWGLLLDFIVTIAISIFSILPYLSFVTEGPRYISLHLGVSVGLIGILYLINYFGAQHSTRISIVLTITALTTQVLILIFALFSGGDIALVFEKMRIGSKAAWSPSWDDFFKGTAMAMVAYTGIESIAALSSETKRPLKTLPRAVIIVMSVLVAMYLGMSIISLSVLSPQELGTKYVNNPLIGVVNHLAFGKKILTPFVGFLVAALLFVAGNAGLMGASRLSFNMGEYYQLPRFFYRTHKKYRTPVVSLGIFALLASLIILLSRGSLHFLADLYNFGAMIAFFSAHMSLIILRFKRPETERSFRAPLNISFGKGVTVPITAIIGAISTFGVWILVVLTKPGGRYLGFIWMALGVGMYLVYRKKKKIGATTQVQIEKVKVGDYKPLEVKKILVPTKGGPETESVQLACELAKFHKAQLTAIHMIQVPYSLPLDTPMPYRMVIAQAVLQRAEAIASEFNVDIQTSIFRCRQIDESILQYLAENDFDLLVIGAERTAAASYGLGAVTDRILRAAPCRVFVAASYFSE